MVKVLAVIVALMALVPGPVKEIHRTVRLSAAGRVFLQTNRGTVEVAGWNRNAVEMHARIAPRSFFASQRACVSETNIRVDAWPNSLRITPEYATITGEVPRLLAALFGRCTERPLVDYRVFVPRAADLTIDGGEANVRIRDVAGSVRVRIAARKMGT